MPDVARSTALPFDHADSMELTDNKARRLLRQMLDAAIAAADPAKVLAAYLPARPQGRCVVVGAGKAAASMAAALEAAWPDVELTGTVAVPYGYSAACRRICVREAGHPLPDDNSMAAAREVLAAVQGLGPQDLVIALISGGGSAALSLPLPELSLEDKQITNKLLLNSGLDIRTMNAVRRRISAIKGGKLAAAAAPAQVVTLAISDIPGDDPKAIASGPTAADCTYDMDLREIVERLGPALPAPVAKVLSRPGQPVEGLNGAEFRLIATPSAALDAAARTARANGITTVLLGDAIEGESRIVARDMAGLVAGQTQPTVLISGGETTVTLAGQAYGRGGRNTEFALALACELKGNATVWVLACDTDGEDGANLGAAGAIAGPDTLRRAAELGIDPLDCLHRHDSGSLFAALDDLVITGPTRTNVNDFRAILVLPEGSF